jgi:hypothetical protein
MYLLCQKAWVASCGKFSHRVFRDGYCARSCASPKPDDIPMVVPTTAQETIPRVVPDAVHITAPEAIPKAAPEAAPKTASFVPGSTAARSLPGSKDYACGVVCMWL